MTSRSDFIDEATVFAIAGDGGDGVVSFQRELFRPKGGPNGGNGGRGGSVIFRADTNVGTLSDLARAPHRRGKRGTHGGGDDRHGANSPDLTVLVPEGTLVRDAETGEVIADLVRAPAEAVVARGGKGGRGNASLSSAKRRAPMFSEKGERGEERRLNVELRVLADVGLVGLPNAGKSSLIARVSAARPKVADYPFTTLSPHLGVADAGEHRFVVADVPGLIEGAAEGRGLGHGFLKHLQRCLVLCFVVDAGSDDADPVAALRALRAEIEAYDLSMSSRPCVVAANKIDLPGSEIHLQSLREAGETCIEISALDGRGIETLSDALSVAVDRARAADAEEEASEHTLIRIDPEQRAVRVLRQDGGFVVVSPQAERLIARFDLENEDAVAYLQDRFAGLGIEHALAAAGAVEGDEVRIGHVVFDFLPDRIS